MRGSGDGRIVADPAILAGKPVVRGTRLSVELILELLAAGEPEQSILESYPGLTREDRLACAAWTESDSRVQRDSDKA